ncbi:hypothetical protein SAMN04488029_3279 [Reichenbachiella faecimaris]|uniref:Uncharacterized protein n=1 Tax=Reichenbachiella faecimaris TaxID=692418 RepID=A0A1W2GL01_REIFA|nr:hypothetical protein [Reichenbachiella faecimaris]SMD37172.1 hypothetical protein SAMN04488029_3279 [Reichenbachiella faecimaris]
MTYRINTNKKDSLRKKYFLKFVQQLTLGGLLVFLFIWIDSNTSTPQSISSLLGFGTFIFAILIYIFKMGFEKQLNYKIITLPNRIESHIGKTVQYIHWSKMIVTQQDNGDIVLEDRTISTTKRWNGIGKILIYSEFENFEELSKEINSQTKKDHNSL